jgi:hypothetical protein
MEKGLGKIKSDLSMDKFELDGEGIRKNKSDLSMDKFELDGEGIRRKKIGSEHE